MYIDSLFDDYFGGRGFSSSSRKAESFVKDGKLTVNCQLPGYDKSDIASVKFNIKIKEVRIIFKDKMEYYIAFNTSVDPETLEIVSYDKGILVLTALTQQKKEPQEVYSVKF